MSLWRAAGLSVPGREPWYIETGQGMRNTIQIAEELGAYTLADRGTYVQYEADNHGNPPLVVLVEGESTLRNQYSVIVINPRRCKDVQLDLALRFMRWLLSSDTQRLIAGYKILGNQLFIPNASEGE
jgi:tungstate transport system substrate-binding protein